MKHYYYPGGDWGCEGEVTLPQMRELFIEWDDPKTDEATLAEMETECLVLTGDTEHDRHALDNYQGSDDTRLYAFVTRLYAGQPLSALPLDEMSQAWPVVDRDLDLTGEIVDSEVSGWWNYSDEAAIFEDEATAGGWTIDTHNGYADPPAAL